MRSNYSAARESLEKAYDHLQDDDETSRKMREAIGMLIDAMVVMQFKRKGQVLEFPPKQRQAPANPQGIRSRAHGEGSGKRKTVRRQDAET